MCLKVSNISERIYIKLIILVVTRGRPSNWWTEIGGDFLFVCVCVSSEFLNHVDTLIILN